MKILSFLFLFISFYTFAQKPRLRDFGLEVGVLKPGSLNAITDITGLKVGHFTLQNDKGINTGVTAIVPHSDNIFKNKVPAAVFVGNGFGKLAGSTQIEELGNLETPILLTNTLAVATALDALIDYTFDFPENKDVKSVNGAVGETNDGGLNDIRARALTKQNMMTALKNAENGKVKEGNVGAGTGTVCFGFKGGIGTSSRVLPKSLGGYTVGVLVQTNFGGVLQIKGVEVGKALNKHKFSNINEAYKEDGSCMIIVATDAPMDARNLKRLAARAMLGLSRTGGMAANGSGDYVIAFSTAADLRIPHDAKSRFENQKILSNNSMDIFFQAAIEATEEAILNSLFAAETLVGQDGKKVEALPVEQVIKLIKKL
jgi:D-aminopeptidase